MLNGIFKKIISHAASDATRTNTTSDTITAAISEASKPLLSSHGDDDQQQASPSFSQPDTSLFSLPKTVVAGQIWTIVEKLFIIDAEEAKTIVTTIYSITVWQDLVLIIFIGWGLNPAVESIYSFYKDNTTKTDTPTNSNDTDHTSTIAANNGNSVKDETKPVRHYKDTRFASLVLSISRIAQLSLLVYVVDITNAILIILGFQYLETINLSQIFAKIVYTLFISQRIIIMKKYVLLRYIAGYGSGKTKNKRKTHNRPEQQQKEGIALFVNHICNAIIYGVTLITLIDLLDLDHLFSLLGIKSAFAFGSVGTIAFTLASQSVMTSIVNGFALTTSNRFYVGDYVEFGHSNDEEFIGGTIISMGWLETVIRCNDDTIMTIPNTNLAGQPVSNLSRVRICQVKQILKFNYTDIDKLDTVLEDIRKEIVDFYSSSANNSNLLITNGSRPFRVIWTDYKDNYLQVLVECHFHIAPISEQYYLNKQEVLKAIYRAVKKNNVQFAVVSS